jgi:hypothetical protein
VEWRGQREETFEGKKKGTANEGNEGGLVSSGKRKHLPRTARMARMARIRERRGVVLIPKGNV